MKSNEGALETICKLAEMLGVDIKQPEYLVGTRNKPGVVKASNGNLQVKLYGDGLILIEGNEGSGIQLRYLPLSKNESEKMLAPDNAVFVITTYLCEEDGRSVNPGVIYLGRDGNVLTGECVGVLPAKQR